MTTTVKYSQVLLALDPAGGTTFAHPCLINLEKSLDLSANFSEDIVPDCDNPDDPAQVLRHIDNVDLTLSGTGKLNLPDLKTYIDLTAAGTKIPAKLRLGAIDATGAVEITCNVVITTFSVTTTRPTTAEVSISLAADGFKASDVAAYVTP